MNDFSIEIINYLDKEDRVAEIYYNSLHWAEISEKQGNLAISFYSHPNKEHWEFSLDESMRALEKAKIKLLISRNKPNLLETMNPPDPEEVNEQAEEILEGILNHPEKKVIKGKLQRYGNIIDIYAPNGQGARYNLAGEFIGFLEL